MDILKSMQVFCRVAEAANFSEVAREMGMSQPSVSKQIAALEKHLNVKLLNRSTRQLNLTNSGQKYYEHCLHIIDELSEFESTLRSEQTKPTGILRINTPITFGELNIVPHLWEFLKAYPDLEVDLIMDDHYIDLVKEGVDVAIRVGPLTDSTLIARKIGNSARVTVASPKYLKKNGTPKNLMELKNHNCIIYTLLTTRNQWHFKGVEGDVSISVDGRFSANNPRTIRQAVLAGQGIAVTPLWLIKDFIKSGEVKVILEDYEPKLLEIHAVYPERRFVSERVTCFIEFIRTKLPQI